MCSMQIPGNIHALTCYACAWHACTRLICSPYACTCVLISSVSVCGNMVALTTSKETVVWRNTYIWKTRSYMQCYMHEISTVGHVSLAWYRLCGHTDANIHLCLRMETHTYIRVNACAYKVAWTHIHGYFSINTWIRIDIAHLWTFTNTQTISQTTYKL